MQLRTALFFALSAVLAAASSAPAAVTSSTPAVVDPAQAEVLSRSLNKRAYCVLGVCLGSSTNYQTDVSNCGAAKNVCKTVWSNGSGAQCVSGVCFPASCNTGYALNSATGQCQSITSDVANCGAIGTVCAVTGATANTCISGTCFATACGTGFTLSSGVCNVVIDTTSDVNNCGALKNKCPSSYYYGSGSKCISGVCQPASCNSGYSFSYASKQCVNTASDIANCGAVGNACSFANGSGKCSSGVCTLSSCSYGFYNINGVCTNLNLDTDPQNCGSVGNVCTIANGVAGCSGGSCTLASCNTGYQMQNSYSFFNWWGMSASCAAVDTTSDSNNCGAIGKVCTFANGSGKCSSGVCTYSSCSNGFYNINNQCTALNLQTDVNNCGSVGNVCSYDNGVGQCSSGQCSLATCNAGYKMNTQYYLFGVLGRSSACSAYNYLTDSDNCGSIGNKCAATYSNGGSGSCVAGQCFTTCNSGYAFDSSLSYCRDVSSDVSNCGAIGTVCSAANGVAKCSNSKCAVSSCSTGYKLVSGVCQGIDYSSDVNNCGSFGKVCPSSYSNGGAGTCVAGLCTSTCNSGFAFDRAYSYCRDVRSDVSNCGSVGNACSLLGASSQACSSGSCIATACSTGYTLKSGTCSTLNLLTDVNNCGSAGNVCQWTPTGASGVCQAGKCVVTTCPTKYTLVSGVCVLSASQHARVKKSKIKAPRTLCPAAETACPISGSSTYAAAIGQHFSNAEEYSGIMAGAGGYECIDTKQALDSCGGCASTGEGVNCSAIRGVAGVGCSEGKCQIFSCQPGWKVSLSGEKCVRSRARHSAAESNHTSHAKRHLSHARAHGHAAIHS